jgi:TonB family protein
MLTQLLASRPIGQRPAVGLGASVALHGLFLAGAVLATMGTRMVVTSPEEWHLFYVPPQLNRPQPVTPAPVAPVAPTLAAGGPGVVSVPIDVPSVLPVIDLTRSSGALSPGTLFVPNGFSAPPAPPMASGAPYLAEQVEVPAAIEKGSPLPRFPAVMRSAGVEGAARFQFVVDTLGRVELSTVREMESTNAAFAMAVRGTLPRMRFTPARAGGRTVRQLVEFPIVFRIER